MNKIFVMGRVGRDPESRYTPAGKHVANFSVAVDRGKGDAKVTTWFNCQAWEKTADVAVQYVRKGKRVLCEGEMTSREYEKDNQKRTAWEVVVRNLQIIDWPEEGSQDEPVPRRAAPPKPAQGSIGDMDDDIPF